MSLYNEFRPASLEQVKGQDHIVTVIRNQIISGKMGHSHLFIGTRGTGKTTVAKIMAKAVNCLNPQNGSPCGECENCKAILNKSTPDVIEMDAASNNGVDNIRALISSVSYVPTKPMKKKVYIIDEVHMLSTGAFNALLKTIEEPPQDVIFILCTTEMHKVPATIASRCQKYQFHRFVSSDLIDNMVTILSQKNIPYEPEALNLIARLADGSCRDSLSLLDQIMLYSRGNITLQSVKDACGMATDQGVRDIVWYLLNDNDKALNVLDNEYNKGVEIPRFVEEIIQYLRNLMMFYHSRGKMDMELSDSTISDFQKFEKVANNVTHIIRLVNVLNECLTNLKTASLKKLTLEVAILRCICPEMQIDTTSILERIRRLEESVKVTA